MSDQNQILRLLATLREEMAAVRARQEELYEVLVSYKDQVHDLKTTMTEKLEGLPTSPYIAGQLVPRPDKNAGVDDFGQMLATYLHASSPEDADDGPVDVDMTPPEAVNPDDIKLEKSDDPPRRRRHRSGRIDPDLSRGPDRDIVPLDLDEPKKKKRRRGRSRKKKASKADD